jgi:hypothetical protein
MPSRDMMNIWPYLHTFTLVHTRTLRIYVPYDRTLMTIIRHRIASCPKRIPIPTAPTTTVAVVAAVVVHRDF